MCAGPARFLPLACISSWDHRGPCRGISRAALLRRCGKHLCPSCSTDVFGDAHCEDCYPKLMARNQDYADEQRALWSEVHGEDYQPSDEEPRSRSRSRSGSYERQIEFEMKCYGRY